MRSLSFHDEFEILNVRIAFLSSYRRFVTDAAGAINECFDDLSLRRTMTLKSFIGKNFLYPRTA